MDPNELAALRRSYSQSRLTRSSVSEDPFAQFAKWIDDAVRAEMIDATAMTLSTVGDGGIPSSRVVLLKGYGSNGFVFYTNYESRKGHDIAVNANVVLHFYWAALERQINITGTANKVTREESEAYFRTRPYDSQIGALASYQSSELASRQELEDRFAELTARYPEGSVPLPPTWGGYRVEPTRIEFWQGRDSRLHDRICYDLTDSGWAISRLSP